MGKTDPRVDQYIAKSADFAKPILMHIRKVVHGACPDVEETMKWSFPHFDYKGMMCSMAAFKGHCAFGFWKSSLVLDQPAGDDGMGHFGKITSLRDLPPGRQTAVGAEETLDRADRFCRGDQEEGRGAQDIRRLQPESASRIR